jgi:hypothetical protein
VCQSCVSDSDCSQAGGTTRCVPMNYQGTPRGGYCLRAVSAGCARPFGVVITAESLSGAASTDYCGIDQAVVSCEAVAALRQSRPCPSGDASQCMADGAVCATVGAFSDRCTYACGGADDCPPVGSASTCNAGTCGS